MLKTIVTVALSAAMVNGALAAALVGSDDFETSTSPGLDGGSPNPATWQEDWQVNGAGSTFLESGNPLVGSNSLGISGAGETWVSRQHQSQVGVQLANYYRYNWQMSSGFDIMNDGDGGVVSRVGGTIREGNDGANPFGGEIFSVFFDETNSSLQYFDGSNNTLGLTFAEDTVYDVSVTLRPRLQQYELVVFQVGSGGGLNQVLASGNYTTGSPNHNLDSFVFLGRTPGGAGEELFFDELSIVRNIPEPQTVAFLGLGMVIIRRFHARRKKWSAPVAS